MEIPLSEHEQSSLPITMLLIASLQERIEPLAHLRGSVAHCCFTIESPALCNHRAKQNQLFRGRLSDCRSDVVEYCCSDSLVLPSPELLAVADIRRVKGYWLMPRKVFSLNSVECG